MTRKPVLIDADFERAAKAAARTCFVCKREFQQLSAMEAHRYSAHPDYGRLRFEWDAKAMKWIGGGL